jgi:hypothetical protein
VSLHDEYPIAKRSQVRDTSRQMVIFGRWSSWITIGVLTLVIAAALAVSQPILAVVLVAIVIAGFLVSRAGAGD